MELFAASLPSPELVFPLPVKPTRAEEWQMVDKEQPLEWRLPEKAGQNQIRPRLTQIYTERFLHFNTKFFLIHLLIIAHEFKNFDKGKKNTNTSPTYVSFEG